LITNYLCIFCKLFEILIWNFGYFFKYLLKRYNEK
jgi:hypothetical protein